MRATTWFGRPSDRELTWIAALIACILPLGLLVDVKQTFQVDWLNHVWQIAYHGEYLRHHLTFPDTLNTNQLVGLTGPIFYGHSLYAAGGILSLALGPDLAVRVLALLCFLVQFVAVHRVVSLVTVDPLLPTLIPILVTWAIYPMTNLYTRGALTEFVAGCFLTAALCTLVSMLLSHRRRMADALAVSVLYGFAALAHPLTAVFGGLLLLVAGGYVLIAPDRKRLLAPAALTVAATALVMSPWLYAMARFHDRLLVRRQMTTLRVLPFDNAWSRLAPFPFDVRSLVDGIRDVSTPYLDTQLNVPLLAVTLGLACLRLFHRTARYASGTEQTPTRGPWATLHVWLIGVGLAVSIVSFAVSVSPDLASATAGYLSPLQFVYRLVNYQNLGLLLVLLGILASSGGRPLASGFRTWCFCALTAGFLSVLMMLTHADAISGPNRGPDPKVTEDGRWTLSSTPPVNRIWDTEQQILSLPEGFYWVFDYAIPPAPGSADLVGLPRVRLDLKVRSGDEFAAVSPVVVEAPTPALVLLNVQTFPWSVVRVNGVLASAGSWYSGSRLSVSVPQGRSHIEYRFVPDRVWVHLRTLSTIAFTACLVARLALWRRSGQRDTSRRQDPSLSTAG